MKYLVISDTHRFINNAIKLIEKIKPDYCIHLGDMAADCEELEYFFPGQKFIFVKGNNDFFLRDSAFPDERTFELEGKTFFVCHGHKYHVKEGPEFLIRAAKEKEADIVLYGHTHRKKIIQQNDMLILNPGSTSSYGVIEIKDGTVNAELFDYE